MGLYWFMKTKWAVTAMAMVWVFFVGNYLYAIKGAGGLSERMKPQENTGMGSTPSGTVPTNETNSLNNASDSNSSSDIYRSDGRTVAEGKPLRHGTKASGAGGLSERMKKPVNQTRTNPEDGSKNQVAQKSSPAIVQSNAQGNSFPENSTANY
jgi:hypothetical protein